MNKRLTYVLIFLFMGLNCVQAQYYDKLHYWKKNPHAITLGVGVGNYLGELGGGSGGKRVWLLDMEMSQFKFSWQLGYQYNFSYRFGGRLNFAWVKVAGSDALTSNPERSYRNLSFKSNIYELSLLLDIYLLRAKPGHMYNIRGAKGHRGMPLEVYTFIGIGGFYYKSTANGVALAGLSTEGQGLEGGPAPYQPYSICFPFGFGLNYIYFKNIKIGLDFGYRFTLTDYIDDASGTYYDNEQLRAQKGDVSADLADPSDGSKPGNTRAGSPRGNPKNKDNYLTAMVTVSYNLGDLSKKGSRPGGKHSFLKKKKRARF